MEIKENLAKNSKNPCFAKTKLFLKNLSPPEKKISFTLFLVSLVALALLIIQGQSDYGPRFGGSLKEGVVGSPRFINPILAQNNDPDLDLVEVIFGSLIHDLTQDFQLSADKTNYTLELKKNIFWHDSEPFTASDVFFTIQLILDPSYRSPLRANFQGVGVEKLDDYHIKFTLKDIYAPFISTLDIGILPEHIWRDISPQGFALAEANIKPVGNGPYKFKKLTKDRNGRITAIELVAASKKSAFIGNLEFKFYESQAAMIKGYTRREIDSISFISPESLPEIEKRGSLNIWRLEIPRYFALFFNMERVKNQALRHYLAGSIPRQVIIEMVAKNEALAFGPDYQETDYKPLDKEKTITITTADLPELQQAATLVKAAWEKLGLEVNISTLNTFRIQTEAIRPRDYEVLLFGEVLGLDPDPFAFWHSSQKNESGLNLSLYDNPKADRLLVEARQEFDLGKRERILADFYKLLRQEAPAIFLYSPNYIYGLDKKVKGLKLKAIGLPAKRLADIENWYIEKGR